MTRIYLIETTSGHKHLVRAKTPAQARRHVAKGFIASADVASQDDLVALVTANHPIEDAAAGEAQETE